MKVKKHSLAMKGKDLVRTVYAYETDHYRALAVESHKHIQGFGGQKFWAWTGYTQYARVEDLIFMDEAVIDLWLKANEGGSMS